MRTQAQQMERAAYLDDMDTYIRNRLDALGEPQPETVPFSYRKMLLRDPYQCWRMDAWKGLSDARIDELCS